jgi:hypothetical protein
MLNVLGHKVIERMIVAKGLSALPACFARTAGRF